MAAESHGIASAALRGDHEVLARLAGRLILVDSDNLVERPWGGDWIRRFKCLSDSAADSPLRFGEAFEISAFPDDEEARRFPSKVSFEDGSSLALPLLLQRHGRSLLGDRFVDVHGACFPLLPKTLDVRELLSVQGHPEGHTEVYVIIEADPGATLRLGFSRDIDADEFGGRLHRGLEKQDELLALLRPGSEPRELQSVIAPWFADRQSHIRDLGSAGRELFAEHQVRAVELLGDLKALYWHVLDSMNAIEVKPGMVVRNMTPARWLPPSGVASAEVHALGNPEAREILALEIRHPGPTFRAWDNVRFPKRPVEVDRALGSLNLRATRPADFVAERKRVPGCDGVSVSIDGPSFRVEHLNPEAGRAITLAAASPHSLHCTSGSVEVVDAAGRGIGRLEVGQSALVPVSVGGYRVAATTSAELVRVTFPER